MLLRKSKIFLIILVALWGLVGGINNFLDFEGGYNTVAYTLNTTDAAGQSTWRAIRIPLVIWFAWAFIPLSKLVSSYFCLLGAKQMWKRRKAAAHDFNAAKGLALVGCCISIVMLYGGFMIAAENYFLLWKTEVGAAALPQAFRYLASIAILAIFVQQADHELTISQ
jgi:predicted small integral membrane protein